MVGGSHLNIKKRLAIYPSILPIDLSIYLYLSFYLSIYSQRERERATSFSSSTTEVLVNFPLSI